MKFAQAATGSKISAGRLLSPWLAGGHRPSVVGCGAELEWPCFPDDIPESYAGSGRDTILSGLGAYGAPFWAVMLYQPLPPLGQKPIFGQEQAAAFGGADAKADTELLGACTWIGNRRGGDMDDKPEHDKDERDCTLPPDHPLPADQLGRYSPERDFFAENRIAEYVKGQAHGEETVQNVERVKTEYVMGAPYEIWDVSTDKDRWWVITNPTNLYSQKHFPSLDYTFSFHVGLMMRVMSRSAKEGEGEASPFDEVIRRQAQAADRLEKAIGAVDFQAVGMQLRECLISLVNAARRRVELDENDELPKDADVVGWNRALMGKVCPGERSAELRSYMNALVEKAWPLVNWLTHHRNANKPLR